MNLNSQQRNAVKKLSQLKAGALFMKMGTGKTKVACDLIRTKLRHIECVIWIAPASLVNSCKYIEEVKKWSSDFFDKIAFFTTEGISQSDFKYLQMLKLAKSNRNFCVLDESIYIKNLRATRTKRLLKDYSLFDFRLILNGTPVTKSLLDLYAQISFLSPNILKMTERQFADNFLIYFFDGLDQYPWRRWSKPANVEALIEIIRPYIFNADFKTECQIRVFNREFCLSPDERRKYTDFKNSFLAGKLYVCFLTVAQKFQMAYTVKCKEKFCATLSLVNKILQRGEKVVIFVKYISEADLLHKALKGLVFSGTRKDDLSLFEKGEDILICTYGVGSVGLNLQCANNIIFYSQTFNFKEKEQAKYRIYRTGQTKPVNIYNLWVDTGLEDVIRYSLTRKRNLLKSVERIISVESAKNL